MSKFKCKECGRELEKVYTHQVTCLECVEKATELRQFKMKEKKKYTSNDAVYYVTHRLANFDWLQGFGGRFCTDYIQEII